MRLIRTEGGQEDVGKAAMGCVVGLVLLAVTVGYFTYSAFAPHLLLNATTRYLYQFRDMTNRTGISVIPALFAEGESKQGVQDKLLSAGLERWSKRYGDDSNHQIFHLVAGHGWFCGYELFVEADYDDQDKLKTATVAQGGACL